MKAFAFAAVLVSGVSVLSSLAVAKDQCADVKPIKADVAKRAPHGRTSLLYNGDSRPEPMRSRLR